MLLIANSMVADHGIDIIDYVVYNIYAMATCSTVVWAVALKCNIINNLGYHCTN